jgi:hypothetical protein
VLRPAAAGVTTDPANDSLALRHSINQQNEIDSLQQIRDGAASTITFAYDPSGNLTDDGVYRYQYDAWGRLLSVHLRIANGGYGALVRAFNYDGLGRLVRAQSPYPDIGTAEGANRIERFYYDGVRRIQEVVIDPVSSMGEALMGASGSAAQAAANQTQQQSGQSNAALTLEEEATSLSIEAAQTSALTGGGTVPGFQVFAEREYIWGPGEGWGVAGTDELLAQFDRTGALTFAITDAGGDMVALVDSGGSSGRARVVGQWTYDAYGNVLSTDHLHPHAYTRVGHKGLIFDRLNVGVADRGDDGSFTPGQFVGHPGCDFDTPRIVPFARGFYHNRNRVYMPELGRFAQADPNASGQTVLSLPVYHGRAIGAGSISFSLQSRYGDGGSLFGYMGGNPWMRSDEMGLFFNPVDIGGAVLMGGIRMLKGGLENMIGTYGSNMEMDFEWAMDWSLPDDFHSRIDNGWVADSFREGMYEGVNQWIEEDLWGLIDPFNLRNIDQLPEFLWGKSPSVPRAAPGALPLLSTVAGIGRRLHGSIKHTQGIISQYRALLASSEARHLQRSTVRMNQALVLNGQVISNLRPDLQYVLRPPNQTPRLVVVEVGLSNTAHPSKWDHMRELVESMGYILDVVVDNSLQK